MKSLFRNLFDFERPETSGERLFFKLFEAFVVGGSLYLAWSWAMYIQRISDVVLPLGIAQYIDISFLFGTYPPLINAALMTVLLLLGFFRKGERYAYMAGFLLLHFQYAARYSLGEIPHSSNVLGMTLLLLALAMIAFTEPRLRRRFTLGTTYFFVGLGYTLAGISKLIGTGFHWSDGRHLWMWINEKAIDSYAKTGILAFNFVQEMALANTFIATALLTFGLVTELLAVLMWWKKFRYPVIWAVLVLHVGIFLSMNIIFKLSMIELTLLGFPWAVWLDAALRRSDDASALQKLDAFSLRYA